MNALGVALGVLAGLAIFAVVVTAFAFAAALCIAAGRPTPKPPTTTVEEHADDIIGRLERPDLDMRWTALDDVQAHRAAGAS